MAKRYPKSPTQAPTGLHPRLAKLGCDQRISRLAPSVQVLTRSTIAQPCPVTHTHLSLEASSWFLALRCKTLCFNLEQAPTGRPELGTAGIACFARKNVFKQHDT